MKLTQLGSKIDRQIEAYLQPVVKELVDQVPGIQSVLLGGGFGRGEGSVEILDSEPVPVNDFELFVITDQKVDEATVNKVASAATAALPVSRKKGHSFATFDRDVFSDTLYVDLKILTRQDLSSLLPMIRYYELKHASTVLWGEDVTVLIPDHSIEDLPLAEGLRVLLNRLSLVLLYFDTDFLGRSLDMSESRALQYLAGKSITDIPTALLLLSGDFVPSYEKRAQIFATIYEQKFPELAKKYPDLASNVLQAAEFKLKPSFSIQKEPAQLWEFYKQTALPVLYYYLEQMSGQKIETHTQAVAVLKSIIATDYYSPYLRYFMQKKLRIPFFPPGITWLFQRYYNVLMMLRMYFFQKRLYLPLLWAPYGYDAHLFSTMIGLLESLDAKRNYVDVSKLFATKKELQKIYKVGERQHDLLSYWQELNACFADAYLLFGYLKLV